MTTRTQARTIKKLAAKVIAVIDGGPKGRESTALQTWERSFYELLRGRDPEETTIVEATTGGGYTGIHRDPITNTNTAEFEVPKPGPQEKRTFMITLSGIGANSGIPRGTVKWERPRLGSGGTDLIAISTPLSQKGRK